jgi:D-lactate dehydrogenase (quinone)
MFHNVTESICGKSVSERRVADASLRTRFSSIEEKNLKEESMMSRWTSETATLQERGASGAAANPDSTASQVAPENSRFIQQLRAIVGSQYVLTSPAKTYQYRVGFRFGFGAALAVVRPANLLEQWRVLGACIAANKIVVMQAANTGLTGGSTPHGDDYDRDVVVVNSLRITRIRVIREGRQVICHSGATLIQLEKELTPFSREPHSVIGSSCVGASVIGGVCNNSGGALIRRGAAYTECALFAQINETGKICLVNHLGINLGHDAEELLSRLDRDAFHESDISDDSGRVASDRQYEDHVRDFLADSPARYNADSRCLFEAAGCAGKLMVFALRLDTFPKDEKTKVFYVGTNDPAELTSIRRDMLATFKELPVCAEYLHRDAFDIAEKYGKDTFLVVKHLGADWLPRLFRLKRRIDGFTRRFRHAPSNLSDRILQRLGDCFAAHLPRKLKEYRTKYRHYLLLKVSGPSIEETRRYLGLVFPSAQGDFFECTEEEGAKALLHRFVAASAAIRYRAIHQCEVEDIVALDVALRRNDENWFETLPLELSKATSYELYYGHFFCHVFHQDYIVKKGHNVVELEHRMWELLEGRGARFPAEHGYGHLYIAGQAISTYYMKLDPWNCFNPGIGRTSKLMRWITRTTEHSPG